MALPISPTPILRGREAKKFDEQIKSDLKKPTTIVDTPKLESAKQLIRDYANRHKKSV